MNKHLINNIVFATQTNAYRSLVSIRLWRVMLFILFLFSYSTAYTQTPKMHIFSLAPEWNGKKFCGAHGYDPSPINAPSFSYSGDNVQETSYDYSWEQKMDNGAWEIVASGKDAKFIPSYNPPSLSNKKPGAPPIKFSWRLIAHDKANGNQSATSEIFSLTLMSGIFESHFVTPAIENKKNFNITLTISGGFSPKKFSWQVVDKQGELASSQKNTKDLSNIPSGKYKVTIADGSCPDIETTVQTPKTN